MTAAATLVAVASVAVAVGPLTSTPADAAPGGSLLLADTFTGTTVSSSDYQVGGSINSTTAWKPCLTASVNTATTPIGGCPASQPDIPAAGDPNGQGALRLTDNQTNEVGYALYQHALPLEAGAHVTFNEYQYNGTGADGVSFFMVDGDQTVSSPGAFGGGLGYDFNTDESKAGIAYGMLGVGLDAYGNYSAYNGSNCSLDPAVTPNAVAVRSYGNANTSTNYCLLGSPAKTTALNANYTLSTATPGTPPAGDPVRQAANIQRKVSITVDPSGCAATASCSTPPTLNPNACNGNAGTPSVTVLVDFNDGKGYQCLEQNPEPNFDALPWRVGSPATTFKFGLAASTGSSTDIHEVDNLSISTVIPLATQLSITQADSDAGVVQAGQIDPTTLTVSLPGTSGPETGGIPQVTDTLPTGTSLAATPNGNGWACTTGGNSFTCTYTGTLPINFSSVPLPPINVPIKASATFSGPVTNVATVSSADSPTDSASLPLEIIPIAQPISTTTPVNTAISVTPPTPIGEGPYTYTIASAASFGTATIVSGQIHYVPNASFNGGDTFTYTATGAGGAVSKPATVTIFVGTAPRLTVGLTDTVGGTIGSGGTANLVSTLSVGAGGGSEATKVTMTGTLPTGASFNATPSGTGWACSDTGQTFTCTITTTVAAGGSYAAVTVPVKFATTVSGPVTFSVGATDAASYHAAPGTDTVQVTPVAFATSATTGVNVPITVTEPLPDGQGPFTYLIAGAPTHGTASVTPTGQLLYTPSASYTGTDTFTYTATDAFGQVSPAATVTITVTSAPALSITAADAGATTSGGTGTVTATLKVGNAGGPEGSPVTLSTTLPSGLSFASTPSGSGWICTVSGPTAACTNSPATAVASGSSFPVLTVLVTAATTLSGHIPVPFTGHDSAGSVATPATDSLTVKPVALPASASTALDTPVTVVIPTADGTGPFTPASVTNPAHGTVSVSGQNFLFTPTTSYTGLDSFTYTETDAASLTSATATVTLYVGSPPTLSIAVASGGSTTSGGTASLTATMSVTGGGDEVTLTTLTGTLPAGLSFSGLPSGTGWTCTTAGTDFTCTTTPSAPVTAGHALPVLTLPVTASPSFSGTAAVTVSGSDARGAVATPGTGSQIVDPVALPTSASTTKNTTINITPPTPDGTGPFTFAIVGNPSHGTATIVSGQLHYVPTTNYTGADSFTYKTTDGSSLSSAAATVTINVGPAPVLTIGLTDGSSGVLGSGGAGVLTAVVTVGAGGGNEITPVTLSGTLPAGLTFGASPSGSGWSCSNTATTFSCTYTPAAPVAPAGTLPGLTLPVSVSSSTSGLVTATVSGVDGSGVVATNGTDALTLIPVAPTATASTTVGTPVVFPVPAPTGTGPFTDAIGTPAANGTASVSGGSFTYTPNANFSGTDTFTYTATGAGPTTSKPATVTVTVNPVALPATATTTADTPVVIAAPTPVGKAPFTYSVVTQPTDGSVTSSGNQFTYTPTTGFSGTDSFTYYVVDGNGQGSAPATVTIAVNPVAGPITGTTTPAEVPVVATAPAPTGTGPFTYTPASPANGTVTVSGNQFTFTPTPGFTGTGSFTYTVTGSGGTTSAPVTVNVDVVPVASGASGTTTAGTPNGAPVDITPTVDATGPVTLTVASAPADGTVSIAGGTFTYTPGNNFSGTDSFTYTATADGGTSAPATVSVAVDPVAAAITGTTTPADTPIAIGAPTPTGTGPFTYTPANPANGTVTVSGNQFTFTPAPGFSGTGTFTYTVTGSDGTTSAPITVSVDVTPVAPDQSATPTAGSPDGAPVGITPTIDGSGTVTLTVVTPPTDGTVSIAGGTFTYTPGNNFSGTDSFTYTATADGGTSAPATVTVTVNPVAGPITGTTTAADTPVVATAPTPAGTGPFTYTPANPANGTVTVSGNQFTFTPAPGFSGTGTFTYTVTDGSSDTSAPVTVSVDVTPVAGPITGTTTPADTSVTIDIPTPTGSGSFTYATANATNGTATVHGSQIDFVPTPGFSGVATFTYTVTADGGTSAPVTVAVDVVPVAKGASITTVVNTSTTRTFPTPVGTGPFTYNVGTGPSHGTLTISGSTYTYTPNHGYLGADSFSYTVSGAGGTSAPVTITIAVTAIPPTVAYPASGASKAGVPVVVVPPAPGGQAPFTYAVHSEPAHGTVTVAGNAFTYTSEPGFNGVDTFTYTVTGAGGTSQPATISITVSFVNNPGYLLLASDGGVFAFNTPFEGSCPQIHVNCGDVVAGVDTPDGQGYWLISSQGGIFAFGNAQYYGSVPGLGIHVNDIVSMAATPDGKGYWVVGADGGIFAFGDANFYGSVPGVGIHVGNIIGITISHGGAGYWMVGSDGGIFSFGDAPFYGSLGNIPHTAPVTGIAVSPDGNGYWLVGTDGGVFAFGDAKFYGSTGSLHLTEPVVGIGVDPVTGGYWLCAADGGIFAFNAPFLGSDPALGFSPYGATGPGVTALAGPVVEIVAVA